ncbi:MAG: DPP IV N-terminal domain-containing protein [Bacteroidales bacterium]
MKKLFFPFLILSIVITEVTAQDKELSIKEAVMGQWTSLAAENIPQLNWIPESNFYIFQKDDALFTSSAKSNKTDTLITLKELNKISDLDEEDALEDLPSTNWLDETLFSFSHNNSVYKLNPFEKTLFEENNDKYVEPLSPIEFLPGDKEKFIWHSRKDGYNHIYLYTTDGRQLEQLTEGEWEVVENSTQFDENGKHLYYVST